MFRYGNKVRSEASRRMLAGARVEEVAGEPGVSQATLYRWKHQGLIDAGRKPGVKSYEPNELERARQRIKDLESESELVKAATALFNGNGGRRTREAFHDLHWSLDDFAGREHGEHFGSRESVRGAPALQPRLAPKSGNAADDAGESGNKWSGP